jgi:hypothetical protein
MKMIQHRIRIFVIGSALLLSPTMSIAGDAQHLHCFRVRDPLKLRGKVQLDSTAFGLDASCKISRAKMFCTSAEVTVLEAFDRKNPIAPLAIFGSQPGDRICYKVRCPKRKLPEPHVADHFAQRDISKLRTSLICTPAVTP